jgi:hypothetical protein
MARRRNRSVFEIMEELGRQPGSCACAGDAAASARSSSRTCASPSPAHERPPARCCRVPARLGLVPAARRDRDRRRGGGAVQHRALSIA